MQLLKFRPLLPLLRMIFWRSPKFLPAILAPFEDPRVGAVGTNKRALRMEQGFTAAAFWNMLGAAYLERQNFDVRATNTIDGGVFVISGRTSAHRTSILQSPEFLKGYLNERFFFGLFGPLNCNDDNFITRYETRHGWKIKIQHCPEGLMETIGHVPQVSFSVSSLEPYNLAKQFSQLIHRPYRLAPTALMCICRLPHQLCQFCPLL